MDDCVFVIIVVGLIAGFALAAYYTFKMSMPKKTYKQNWKHIPKHLKE